MSTTSVSGWAWDRFREDLRAAGFGNGCHSFLIDLRVDTIDEQVGTFSATIDGSEYGLNRSPFRLRLSAPASNGHHRAVADLQSLRADIDSFVVLDLVCDEKAVRFSGGTAKPLVLGVRRDEWTEQVDLSTG